MTPSTGPKRISSTSKKWELSEDTAVAAWQELGRFIPELRKRYQVIGALSLYRFEPEMIYRAGLRLAAKPADSGNLPAKLPPGLA
ncbi:MAG: hypothetical protein H7222_04615 [Methylotenera sp.]|nr:hypothetical protein [Oligoflexia bacterium]